MSVRGREERSPTDGLPPSCLWKRGKVTRLHRLRRPVMIQFMTEETYGSFKEVREAFRTLVQDIDGRVPWLGELLERMRIARGHLDYCIETPVVYNSALDAVGQDAEPRFILVADNPGKKEQLEAKRSYLVGQSGKLAEGWFLRELELDFRRHVVILNKTPVHTPRTAELGALLALAGPRREELLAILVESQRTMAGLAFRLHRGIGCPVWISGYGELGPGKLFSAYAAELTRLYADAPAWMLATLWLFRHFSMNQFAIEMRQKRPAGEMTGSGPNTTMTALAAIGVENRKRILGF